MGLRFGQSVCFGSLGIFMLLYMGNKHVYVFLYKKNVCAHTKLNVD